MGAGFAAASGSPGNPGGSSRAGAGTTGVAAGATETPGTAGCAVAGCGRLGFSAEGGSCAQSDFAPAKMTAKIKRDDCMKMFKVTRAGMAILATRTMQAARRNRASPVPELGFFCYRAAIHAQTMTNATKARVNRRWSGSKRNSGMARL